MERLLRCGTLDVPSYAFVFRALKPHVPVDSLRESTDAEP